MANNIIKPGRKKNRWGRLSPAHIAHIRTVLQLSQQKLAEKVGSTTNAVGSWERDENAPNQVYSRKLIAILDTIGWPESKTGR